jgi:Carboxypeptidase regulatory-like domain
LIHHQFKKAYCIYFRSERSKMGSAVERFALFCRAGLVAGALALTLVAVGHGQINVGSITGTVTDSSGGIVVGVTVSVVNNATGIAYSALTNQTGTYRIPELPTGVYSATFKKSGYSAVDRANVEIRIGQDVEINQVLAAGSVSETVKVTSEIAILETGRATVNLNLDAEALTDLPLDVTGGRDITTFAYTLVPTTQGSNFSGHIAGSQDMTKNVIVDGDDAIAGLGGFLQSVGMESVNEFEVQTSGITAEGARTGGGNLVLELKSGTNKLHGSAYGFLANEVLDANTWDNKYFLSQCASGDVACEQQYRRPVTRFHDYGFSGGGPIWKDHTFIFADFENYKQNQYTYQQNGQTVPTQAFLQGNFSALLGAPLAKVNPCTGLPYITGQVFDPNTEQVVGGVTCYTPFPNNTIPAGRFSSVASNIVKVYQSDYAPANGNLTNNYPSFNGNPFTINRHVDMKFDHQITPTERFTSSYNWWSLPRLLGGNLWQTGTPTGGPLSAAQGDQQYNYSVRLQLTSTISPTKLNFFSFAYNENSSADVPNQAVNPAPFGFTQTGGTQNFPVVYFNANGVQSGTVNGVNETQIGNRFSDGYVYATTIFNDTFTMTHGKHTFKVGGDYLRKLINSRQSGIQTYNFSNTTNSPLDPTIQPYVGFAFANFLLGDVQNSSSGVEYLLHGRRKLFSFFAQDDWKIRPNLTLNLGLRYDFNAAFHETNGRWTNFDINTNNPAWGNALGAYQFLKNGSGTFETEQNPWQFGPHVGGTYQPINKLVVRAAYGLFYVPLELNQYQGVPLAGNGGAVGYIGTNNILNPSQNQPAYNWDGGYPGTPVFPPTTPTLTNVSGGAAYVAPNTLTLGYTQNWNVGFQYSLTPTAVFSMNYLGNIGRKLHDASLVPLDYPTLNTYLPLLLSGNVNNAVSNPGQAAAAGVPYPYAGFTGYAYQAINPFPQLAAAGQQLRFDGPPGGVSGFRALIAEIETRSWHNLTTDLNYTFSRAEGNVNDNSAFQDGPGPAYTQNPYDAAQRAHNVLDFNMTHVVKGYVNYNLPFGHNQRFLPNGRLVDLLVGGFTVGSNVQYNSGTPFTAIRAANQYPGYTNLFANRNPGVSTANHFKTLDLNNLADPKGNFFSPQLYSNPSFGTLGNQPSYYTALTNWGQSTEDLSVIKHFRFGSDSHPMNASVRVQFFDVFNRHYWGNPNTSITSPFFGQVTGVSGFRYGQFGARFEF